MFYGRVVKRGGLAGRQTEEVHRGGGAYVQQEEEEYAGRLLMIARYTLLFLYAWLFLFCIVRLSKR